MRFLVSDPLARVKLDLMTGPVQAASCTTSDSVAL